MFYGLLLSSRRERVNQNSRRVSSHVIQLFGVPFWYGKKKERGKVRHFSEGADFIAWNHKKVRTICSSAGSKKGGITHTAKKCHVDREKVSAGCVHSPWRGVRKSPRYLMNSSFFGTKGRGEKKMRRERNYVPRLPGGVWEIAGKKVWENGGSTKAT